MFTSVSLPEIVQSYYPNAYCMESTSHDMEVCVSRLQEKYGNDWTCSFDVVRNNSGRIKCVHITKLGFHNDFETLFYADDVTLEDLRRGCDGLVAQFAYAG